MKEPLNSCRLPALRIRQIGEQVGDEQKCCGLIEAVIESALVMLLIEEEVAKALD